MTHGRAFARSAVALRNRNSTPDDAFALCSLRWDQVGPDGKNLPSAHVFGNEVGEEVDNVKKAWRGAERAGAQVSPA